MGEHVQGKPMKKHRAPHTRIDNRVFSYMSIIGTNGFAVYAVLKKHENRHTGRCYPAYSTIAEITGLNRTTVIKYTTLLATLGLIDKQAQFIDGRQTSNRYSFRDLPASSKALPAGSKGGGIVQPPQDRGELPDPPGGGDPPQPLTLEPELTKKQMECPHKDIARPVEAVAYCRSCYLSLEDIEAYENSLTALSESGLCQISESNSE